MLERLFFNGIAAPDAAPAVTGPTFRLPDSHGGVTLRLTQSQLLAGFSDADGDTLTARNLGIDHGSVAANADGSFSVTYAHGYAGPVTLSYQVSDGVGGVTAASLRNAVVPDAAPSATGATFDLPANHGGATLRLTQEQLTAGFTDANGDVLTARNPTIDHGSVTANADGSFTVRHANGHLGAVNLRYEVSDGLGGVANASADGVIGLNAAPARTGPTYQLPTIAGGLPKGWSRGSWPKGSRTPTATLSPSRA